MLDTFLGLPLHPMVVHAAVVLLPLTALGLIALAIRPAWRARFAMPLPDASDAFSNQHSGNPLSTSTLERYLIGPLED